MYIYVGCAAEGVLDNSTSHMQSPSQLSVDGTGMRTRVSSCYIRQMSEAKLLIPSEHIKLLDSVGQGKQIVYIRYIGIFRITYPGEFGVVYRGQLSAGWAGRKSTELVAVKTLKGTREKKVLCIHAGIMFRRQSP